MGLLEVAAFVLASSERRVEIAARNVSNANTTGYKREVSYAEAATQKDIRSDFLPLMRSSRVLDQAVLVESGNPFDLAISGSAFVFVRDGERFFPVRGGQFMIDADGAFVDGKGRALQQSGGGDLVVESGAPVFLADGTVLVGDVPVGSVGLYEIEGREADLFDGVSSETFGLLGESDTSELRQGMLERSNVTLSDEIVGLMQMQRMGEGAAQIVRAYDQLLGQATATFGRSGK